ncbi:peptidylprolyl isomerase [soil metagenome]
MILDTLRRTLLGTVLALGATAVLAQPAPKAKPRVELDTTAGTIVIELEQEKAPITVDNFLKYVKSGQYAGTIFHRVIDGFMVQGGGFTTKMDEKPTRAPIKIESSNGLKNVRGSVAMARTSDPNSATSQFFINVVDNGRLDYPGRDGYGYAVFGTVVEGMDVVDKIRVVPVGPKAGNENVPLTPIVITKATLLK